MTAQRTLGSERLAELLLAALVFIGSFVLVAIPFATLWLLSQLVGSAIQVYVLALIACPAAVMLWGSALIRMEASRRRLRGDSGGSVLDPSITVVVLIALAALLAWYLLSGATGPGPRVVI
jgi:hypothetical protein